MFIDLIKWSVCWLHLADFQLHLRTCICSYKWSFLLWGSFCCFSSPLWYFWMVISLYWRAASLFSQGTPDMCCTRKTVGGISYSLMGSDPSTQEVGCGDSCVYSRDDLPGSRICFLKGGLPSTCHANSKFWLCVSYFVTPDCVREVGRITLFWLWTLSWEAST